MNRCIQMPGQPSDLITIHDRATCDGRFLRSVVSHRGSFISIVMFSACSSQTSAMLIT